MARSQTAILKDPCLAQFDPHKWAYLHTDFSSVVFGYVILQPGNDKNSLDTMECKMNGGDCKFMCKGSNVSLKPIAFGSFRSKDIEKFLHSYLGEGFAGDWAINKNYHFCWAMEFTWITLVSFLSFPMMTTLKLFAISKCN